MQDAILLKLLYESPDEGVEKLIELYSSAVYSIVRNKLIDVCTSGDIDDCVSDVFSDFYISINSYDPSRSKIKTYLCTIANNKATDLYRKYKKRINDVSIDDSAVYIQLSDTAASENRITDAELCSEVSGAILAMDEPDRSILIRTYYFGESSRKIGERLGISEQTVNTRAHRALKRLKETLGDVN